MSDTPRTDAELETNWMHTYVVPDFARQLERELIEARAQLKQAYDDVLYISTMPEYDQDDCHRLRNLGMQAASKLQAFIKP
jgi:hypothetical protein